MNKNRFGYDYLAVPDVAEEMRHARAARLGGGLFFQTQVDFARDFKMALPNANVVIRNWPDGTLPASVDDWLAKNRHLSEGGLIVQTVNEIGLTPANIEFHTQLLERIKRDKIDMELGILAMSVGTPDPDKDWPRAEKMLRLADELRDKVHIILHEYYGGVVTSGFHGGDPTLIQPETWPDDTSDITMFHVGRYRFLKKHCQSKEIPLPRIIIGEFNADFTGDIGVWLTKLRSTKGKYDIVDGWRDLTDQWRIWWPEWDGATALMKQAEYADKHIYTDPEVETILMYARWNDGRWGTYQVNPEIDKQMEVYSSEIPPATLPEETPPVIITPTPKPIEPPYVPVRWISAYTHVRVGSEGFLRSEANNSAEELARVFTNQPVQYDSVGLVAGWWHVKYGTHIGYISNDTFAPLTQELPAENTEPPILPPPQETLPQPPFQTYQYQMAIRIMADTEESADVMAKWLSQSLSTHYQQLRHEAAVLQHLPHIQSAQFDVDFSF